MLKEQLEARKIIEALRLGIVPQKYVEEFTFGREKEIKQIKSWLSNEDESSLILVGEYGVGKTHILEYLYSYLLKDNWAVSIVNLDPNELPFHKPKRVYEAIISSFRFGKNRNFRDFLKEISESRNYYELKDHQYLGVVIKELKEGNESEYLFEWIEGKQVVGNPPMFDYSTSSNIYCNILNGIGWASKNVLGLNGFVIMFDEAETVDSFWYSSYQNEKSWNFLKGMLLMTSNKKELLEENITPFFTSPYGGKIYLGEKTGLQYGGRFPYLRYLWRAKANIKLIFAFVPSFNILDKEPLNALRKIEIKSLNEEYFEDISKSVIRLYEFAYNFKTEQKDILKRVPKNKTRMFIKGLVEALDLLRFYPNEKLEDLLK
ncbi:MAG: DUF2791 family P-loop domain-containing protein [Thermoproteota archaeon]|nr:DUF2791 family P-loop domain-containing protein [Candidatus Brockarchaeota archaeon]